MSNCYKKRLSIFLLSAVTVVLFAASAFGAVGNAALQNNIRVFPNLVSHDAPVPMTNPVVPMAAALWVNEEVWVEVPSDVDEDGKRDLCCFHYSRPISSKESANIMTTPLLLCPTLITASPYAGGSVSGTYYSAFDYQYMEPKVDGPFPGENNPSTMHYTYDDVKSTTKLYKDIVAANFKPDWLPPERTTWIIEKDGANRGTTVPSRIPGFTAYFRPRGYAYGTYYSLGNRAEGFCMNKPYEEAISTAAVVDWLNGRVKAYRYPYPVRLATAAELASNQRLNATTPNLNQNTDGTYILDNMYIRDDVNGGYVEVKAYWATGDACMSGTSYDGALPLMGMMTGVEGLKVIVPFASVAGSYEYYRANGTVYAPGAYQGEDIPMYFPYCGGRMYINNDPTNPIRMGNNYPDIWNTYYQKAAEAMVNVERETGNYNAYYDVRHGVKKEYVETLKGIVILWHGANDLNVKFKNASVWWEAIRKVPGARIKLMFSLMKHAAPSAQDGFNFYPRIHGVLDKEMYGLNNTALEDWPTLTIQNNETLVYESHDTWPLNDRIQKFYLTNDRVGKLSINKPSTVASLDFRDVYARTLTRPNVTATSSPQMASTQYQNWRNRIIGGTATALTTANPFNIVSNDDRLIYTVDISQDTRISGYINVTAKVAPSAKVGVISAMLVDLGAGYHVHRMFGNTANGTTPGTSNVSSVTNYPAGSAVVGGTTYTWTASTTTTTRAIKSTTLDPWNIIARGSVSVQKPNYSGKTWIDSYETNWIPEYYYRTEVIEPGKFYPYTWELNVMDYTIPAGHKLGLILYTTDPEYTQRPRNTDPVTTMTVEIGPDTYLSLPIVGEFVTDEIPDPIAVTGVTVAPTSATILVGSTQQLTATVAPANAASPDVTWSSSAPSVATVSATGLVTAVSVGTATITVQTVDGGFTATCAVTVQPVLVTGVTVSPSIATILDGYTQQLTATVAPANATNQNVTWTSSATSVATVNATGLVTAVSVGTATITVETVDGSFTATCAVTVQPVLVTGVTVAPTTATITEGYTQQLTATIAPANATNQNVTWTCNNPVIAIVSSTGLITAASAGTAIIEARTVDGAFSALCNIIVTPVRTPPTITTATLQNGTAGTAYNQTLAATGDTPTWDISSGSLPTGLTLSATGVISGMPTTPGTTSFTVRATNAVGNDTRTLSIVIDSVPPAIATVSLPNGNIGTAYNQTLAATGDTPMTWDITSGSLPTDLTLNSLGVISGTPSAAGTFNFTVRATNVAGSDTRALTIVIAGVTQAPVSGVTVSPKSATVEVGNTRALTADVIPSDATNKGVTWSSSNGSIATVSGAGVVSAVAAGTATITVKTDEGGFEDTCVITVLPTIETVDPTYPSDLNGVANDTGIAASDLEAKDGKVYLGKALAEAIAKGILHVDSVNTGIMPVFEGAVAPDGQVAQLTFSMTGKDLLASFADDINLIGMISGASGKRFSYTNNPADYGNGKFTLLLGGAVFNGEIDPNATYQLVAFIQDGGEFDLDGSANGEFISSVFVASEKKGGGGGGCSAYGYLALAMLAIPFVLKRKSK